MPPPAFKAELISKTQLSNDTLQLAFQLEENTFSFQAGQFIAVQFELDGKSLKRSYSIANSPSHCASSRQIEIAISLMHTSKET
jgi:ferredoxin-NADP reductase